jgi:putative addiction module component (TIGR02574 family)
VIVDTVGQEIVEAALRLPERQRAEIVQELLASLSPDEVELVEDAWAAELDRRLAEFEAGTADPVPWDELKHRR